MAAEGSSMKHGIEGPSKPKIAPLTFGWLRKDGKEMPVFITSIEGIDLHYRTIRDDGCLGTEYTIFAKTDALRPAAKNEFSLVVQFESKRNNHKKSTFEISLPTKDGTFVPVEENLPSRSAALRIAQTRFGADTRGRVSIVNEVAP